MDLLRRGEHFLYYPLMLAGIRNTRQRGLQIGVVTNACRAATSGDAAGRLKPLKEFAIGDLSISDDAFHHGGAHHNPAQNAVTAAGRIDLPVGTICIESPAVQKRTVGSDVSGKPVIGAGVRFRGRAVEKRTAGRQPGGRS